MTNLNQFIDCAKCREITKLVESEDSEVLTYRPSSVYAESSLVILVDVKKAYELAVVQGLEPTFADDPDSLARLVSENEICEDHIYHVNPNEPGLLVTFNFYNLETRSRESLNVLADGNHRAIRSLSEGLNFHFYYLDVEATSMIVEGWR
jgi:hypothetical protein